MTAYRGFALLETLLATTLLVVCVLSGAQVFLLTARANRAARQMTLGSMLAAQKVEELRAVAFSVHAEGTDRIGEFSRTWTVSPLGADPANTAIIDVRVTPGAIGLVTLRRNGDDP